MAYLEEILPEIRKGKKARLKGWPIKIWPPNDLFSKEHLTSLNVAAVLSNDWELVPEPVCVAGYLVPVPFLKDAGIYAKETYPIGQQPEGSVLVPGSEREVVE
jgi:hypothetical protein